MSFETQLTGLQTDLKSYVATTGRRMDELQCQLDAIDLAGATRHSLVPTKGLDEILKENDSVQRLLHNKKGTAVIRLEGNASRLIETKTVITETATGTGLSAVGSQTTGVLPIDRVPGIVSEARYALRLRNVL